MPPPTPASVGNIEVEGAQGGGYASQCHLRMGSNTRGTLKRRGYGAGANGQGCIREGVEAV